ncbi:MAG: exosome complex exonuclease Rrp41 [Thermoplasmata archaeon]|nr:exosome complex exonuclease Rrp41 [Thermoplasmata archaeon]MCJ7562097.1 exosome complex exonuclease Rrp41 [Thermoplasmata archaeon]TFG70452.1 MAG: exosome complex exonuclease Rrp41 [Methanomassiliicoccus sp.]
MGGTPIPNDIKLLDENGKRVDGRRPDEMRPIKIEAGVLNKADGSAYVEWGLNKVLAAVYGPRECHPRHLQNTTRALVQCHYNMAAFSVDDRKRPGPDRRSHEISKITSEALTHVVFTEYFPRTSIDVYIEVLQANAGTRCAGLTAASVALADAGVPMRDLVASCAAGKAADTVMVDLGKEEDNFGQADVPVGYVPRTEEIVLLQMDGELTHDEYTQSLKMAIEGCKKVYEEQRNALKRRYQVRSVDAVEEPKEVA